MRLEVTKDTREEDIASLVEAVQPCRSGRDTIVDLLSERNPVFTGRSANATMRIRGYALAAFERVGLPENALLYVHEELESGRDAYLVAAAAKALRGYHPSPQLVPYLATAIKNVRYRDDAVTFDSMRPSWPSRTYTTALTEILTTIAWLGADGVSAQGILTDIANEADVLPASVREALERAIEAARPCREEAAACFCCSGDVPAIDGRSADRGARDGSVPLGVEFEDQDGKILTFGDFFVGHLSVLAFFYTRCSNPNKCSFTIAQLARMQDELGRAAPHQRLRIAAITYDPGFDLPPRLRAYGENRGFVFDENCRFLRSESAMGALDEYFQLGVSYGPAAVNRHRIELFILQKNGRIAFSFTRLRWDVGTVLANALSLVPT